MTNEFNYQMRVYYADTDCGGVVYNANYLTFTERARDEWFFAQGFDPGMWHDEGIYFVLYSAQINFIKPARLFDIINISCAVTKMSKASLEMQHFIYNASQPKLIYCKLAVKLVCVNGELKPRAIPSALAEKIRNGT